MNCDCEQLKAEILRLREVLQELLGLWREGYEFDSAPGHTVVRLARTLLATPQEGGGMKRIAAVYFDADSLAVAIRRKRHARGLTLREAIREIGIGLHTLHRAERAEGDLRVSTLAAIAAWLPAHPALFFVATNYRRGRSDV